MELSNKKKSCIGHFNTLTTDDEHSGSNGENLPLPIDMHYLKNQKVCLKYI